MAGRGKDEPASDVVQRIVGEEEDLLDQVLVRLDGAEQHSRASEASVEAELERLQELLGEGAEAKDRAALLEQYHRHAALLRQLRESGRGLPVQRESPYFAHLRLREEREEWDLCLGNATFIEGDVRIVDWRNAPISQVFYAYREGDEFEETIAARLRSGWVTARRTLSIRDARLERIESPAGTLIRRDGTWRRVAKPPPRLAGGEGAVLTDHLEAGAPSRRLGTDVTGRPTRADKHLPDIAGLLDPSQFELITQPGSGVLVVRGVAGSGKTTVALHRIAYLAYARPEIDSPRSLFVVFSPALRRYVSQVLPALGVGQVRITTFPEWAHEQRVAILPRLPRGVRTTTPAYVQRLKLHAAMLPALEAQVRRVNTAPSPEQVIDDWASTLGRAELLREILHTHAPEQFRDEEIQKAVDWHRARAEELEAWRGGDESVQAELDAEDDVLLLRAWQLRMGALPIAGRKRPYSHLAIDEVQDFSPLEVRVLLDCVDAEATVTLAGDTQQHIMQEAGFSSWEDFFSRLGLSGTQIHTLEVSYRSSQPIVSFAQEILGEQAEGPTPAATRDGPPVELFRFTDHGAAVAFLADALDDLTRRESHASIAVLTPNRDLSNLYARGLARADLPDLHQVRDYDFRFRPGIEVTEIAQVKGLELDYVILVGVDAGHFPDTAHARRLLHVGATRAIHQLWLTSVGTPSPIVRPLLEHKDDR